ncbi:MAG: hypothetical protein WCX22_13180 [Methanoregula sp.]
MNEQKDPLADGPLTGFDFKSFGSTLPKLTKKIDFWQYTTKSILTIGLESSKLSLDGGNNNDTKTTISLTANKFERQTNN